MTPWYMTMLLYDMYSYRITEQLLQRFGNGVGYPRMADLSNHHTVAKNRAVTLRDALHQTRVTNQATRCSG